MSSKSSAPNPPARSAIRVTCVSVAGTLAVVVLAKFTGTVQVPWGIVASLFFAWLALWASVTKRPQLTFAGAGVVATLAVSLLALGSMPSGVALCLLALALGLALSQTN